MRKTTKILFIIWVIVALGAIFMGIIGGEGRDQLRNMWVPHSDSGVKKTTVQVPTNPEGLTIEQQNIRDRLVEDNRPGSVKHLYVISAYSGQIIIYSTVRGKVTSSGKRLTPTTSSGIPIRIGNWEGSTDEVLQDDGTYGHSSEYLYWWDTKGVYHQHYISGGQIVHISSQPLVVKGIIINMELTQKPEKQK